MESNGINQDARHDDKVSTLDEYRTLVDLIKQQHTRYNDFCKVFLLCNTILVAACGAFMKSEWLSLLLGFAGIFICRYWRLTTTRLNADTAMRYEQLRDRELKLYPSGAKGIFREGYENFALKEGFRVRDVGILLANIFIVVYAILLALPMIGFLAWLLRRL